MILIPYILSIAIGSLLVLLLLKSRSASLSLTISLGSAFGLGASGIITFLSLITIGKYSASFLIITHLFMLSTLIFFIIRSKTQFIPDLKSYFQTKHWIDYSAPIIFCIAGFSNYILASRYPFGGWDAWALWNMKLKFIVYGAEHWNYILTKAHWHTQPDYPLLLSCINAWLMTTSPKAIQQIPFITAILFSMTIGVLLYGSLKQLIKPYQALIAAGLLLSNSYYILLSTSQYADVLLSLFLLCTIITLYFYQQTRTIGSLILAGCFMGLMSFTKNEGIVMGLLLIGIYGIGLLISYFRKSTPLKDIIALGVSYFIFASITAAYKLFLTPKNPDIVLFSGDAKYEFLNLHGLKLVAYAFFQQLLHPQWGYIWLLILGSFILFLFRFFKKANLWSTLFFIAYALVIVAIYLTTINFDLSWRLTFTLKRIMLYCLPSLLFVCFKVIYEKPKSE